VSGPSFRTHLRRLWRLNHLAWLRYARRLVTNEADAEDVVQDAARDSLRANPEVESAQHANAYMFAVIRSKSHRHSRQRGVDSSDSAHWRRSQTHEASAPSSADIAIQAEDEEEDQRLLELAKQGISTLPDEPREALELLFFHQPQMTLREVAEMKGVSISTVHRRVARALDALRAIDETIGTETVDGNDDST